jgi:hypothetical protein
MKSTLIALATAGLLASGGASAGTTNAQVNHSTIIPVQYSSQHSDRWDDRSGNVNEREARIRARIERGLHDGRITTPEARRLYRQLAAIEARERAFMADGRLSYREDAELKRGLDQLAANVSAQLRDDDHRRS